MASSLLSFSLLLNALFCLYYYATTSNASSRPAVNESNTHTHSHSHASNTKPKSDVSSNTTDDAGYRFDKKQRAYNRTSSEAVSPFSDGSEPCTNPECHRTKGTDSTILSPEEQIFAQLGTIKEILDSLPPSQQARINAFLGTLESRRFEEDLPTTYASLSKQNKETSEQDVIFAYQQFKEFRFEEVAVVDEDEEDSCCDSRRRKEETGLGKLLDDFVRTGEIREKSHLIGTLLLEDALENMRDRDKRVAFTRYEVAKPKRRASIIEPNLGAIEEVETPASTPRIAGSSRTPPAGEAAVAFTLDDQGVAKGLAKKRFEEMMERDGELHEEDEGV